MTNKSYISAFERACLAMLSVIVFSTTVPVQAVQAAPAKSQKVAVSNESVKTGYVIPSKKVKAALVTKANLVADESDEVQTVRTLKVAMTAYSSAPNQTDSSPFITADGSVVADGIVATNVLPFGTKIRIPAYFGDRVFEVHDRMNTRYSYRVDIWMSNRKDAVQWGLKRNVTIEVVEMGDGKKNWDQWKGRSAELARVGKYGK